MDSQHGRKLMEYIAFISESLQHEIGNMKGRHGTGLGRVGEKKFQVPGIVGLQRLHHANELVPLTPGHSCFPLSNFESL